MQIGLSVTTVQRRLIDVYPFSPKSGLETRLTYSSLLQKAAKAKIPQNFKFQFAKCWKVRGTKLQVLIILNKNAPTAASRLACLEIR